ncbi:MAG: chemotaxis protein CheW [Nitrospina sp.]|jgi:purine-binding chemotaxis protein CheW|nr:chemotaxis protein CheW [Nitrospina sp.]
MTEQNQFCTFYLDNHTFGVKVEQVQEVFRYQEMTKVPLAPPEVRGLINLRGQIITAIDLRLRLGMAPGPDDKLPMNVVVRTQDGVVSLLVDEIGDVLEAPDDVYERPPETIPMEVRNLVLGVYKLEGRLLLILDSEKAVNVSTGVMGA